MGVLKGMTAYITLFCMMACWILEGELNQNIVAGCDTNSTNSTNSTGFDAPNPSDMPCYENHFFMAFCTRICWSLIFFCWAIWRSCCAPTATYENDPKSIGKGLGMFTWGSYLKWGAILGIVIFASTYTWYLSLPLTSMAGNSAVYMTAPVFVFMFSVPLLKETVTFMKVFAVLLCVAGSAVVAVYGQGNTTTGDSFIGYVWVVVSVVLYSGFEVFYKKYTCDDNDPFPVANSQRFFGLCGIAAVITMWPMFFLLDHLHGSKYGEKFEWPDSQAMPYVIIISLADTMFNVFLLITILLSSPLFTSIGTVAVIPLSSVVDYLYRGLVLTKLGFVGAGLILIGFLCMVYAEHKEHKQKHKKAAQSAYNDVI